MSDFYTPPADIPAVSRAKAIQINELKDSVVAGFDAVETELDGYMDDIMTAKTNAEDSATASANSASDAADSATEAADSATEAADSATEADGYTTALSGTSSTSVVIGTGSKTFTVELGKKFAQGQFVSIISDADSDNYMHGAVTSYSGTTLVVAISNVGGDGAFSDWSISVSGSQGPRGETGPGGAYYDFLYTIVADGASEVVFEDDITDAYRGYIIESDDCAGAATIMMQFGTGTTPTYQTSGYDYRRTSENTGATAASVYVSSTTSAVEVGAFTTVAPESNSLSIKISNPSEPTKRTTYDSITLSTTSILAQKTSCFGKWDGVDSVTAVKVYPASGTITGTFKFYGVI